MIPTLIAVLLLAGLLFYEKRDRAQERKEWTSERRLLLTRIQAPETVPPEIPDNAPVPLAVHPDDDADYWRAYELRTNGGS